MSYSRKDDLRNFGTINEAYIDKLTRSLCLKFGCEPEYVTFAREVTGFNPTLNTHTSRALLSEPGRWVFARVGVQRPFKCRVTHNNELQIRRV